MSNNTRARRSAERGWPSSADVCTVEQEDSKEFFRLPEGKKYIYIKKGPPSFYVGSPLVVVCLSWRRRRNWMDPIQSSRLYCIPLFFLRGGTHKAFSVCGCIFLYISFRVLILLFGKKSHPTLAQNQCLSSLAFKLALRIVGADYSFPLPWFVYHCPYYERCERRKIRGPGLYTYAKGGGVTRK